MQPILVILDSQSENRFSSYITEILDIEGVFCRDSIDLSANSLTTDMLQDRDMVILSQVSEGRSVEKLLREYVTSGGTLIVSRPSAELSELCGITPTNSIVKTYAEGYVNLLDNWLTDGLGISDLQFHGDIDLYEPTGADVIATLSAEIGTKTHYPAIFQHTVGKGQVMGFSFDLARAIVLFHQGNKLNASNGPNPDPDRDIAYKTSDLFFKYLDERLKSIPQADIYQDILVRMINSGAKRPLPRIWHYPDGMPSVAIISGDSDSMNREQFDETLSVIEESGGKFTIYLMPEEYDKVPPEYMRELQQRGHDFGPHPFPGRKPTLVEARERLKYEVKLFTGTYGFAPVSYRMHNLIWVGWLEQVEYGLEQGLRLDNNWLGLQYGYGNGSGLPFKFMDENGRIIDVYEQTSFGSEDAWCTDKTLHPSMTVPEAIQFSLDLIDETADRYHGVYHACFHPVYIDHHQICSKPWVKAVCEKVRDKGILFCNDREWLDFNDARRTVSVKIDWNQQDFSLQIELSSSADIKGLTILLPNQFENKSAVCDTGKLATLEGKQQFALTVDLEAGVKQSHQIRYSPEEN